MMHRIKLDKTLLLLYLLCANYGFSVGTSEIRLARKKVERFVAKGDTSGIDAALKTIDQNFAQSVDPELLNLMLKVSRKEAKLSKKALKKLYFIIRRFYETETTKTKNFEYSLKIYKILSQTDDYEGLMWILIDIGNIFYSEKDYDQAYIFYRKAERAAHKTGSNYGLSIIYQNYGMIDERRKQHEQSLEHYRTGSFYRLRSGNIKVAASNYIKMALASLNLNRPDSCLHYIHLTEKFYYHKGQETHLVKEMPHYINYVYAEYYLRRNDFDKALEHIRIAGKYSRDNGLMGEMIASNAFEASYLYKAGRYNEAIEKAQELMPLFRKHGLLDQQKFAYRMLKKSYSALKQYEKAAEASANYVLIDDSLHNHRIKSELNMIRSIAAVYESEAKLNQIRKNLQLEKVHNHIQDKQRNASVLIAVFSILSMLIITGFFLNSKLNKLKLVALHRQLLLKNQEVKINSLELRRSNHLKDNLFSIIGNDLRNPLHRMLEELEVVKHSIGEQQLTMPIENTLKETILLFEGLLEWSKTGQKQNIFSPVKVNLDENINKVILFYLPEIQAREIKIINKSAAIATFADQNIVQTLVRNLLGNAIAAVSKIGTNGMIEIETEQRGEQIEITLSDSGEGFPQEILDKFNDEKFDVNAKSKGLGLSICKALAKMSGWKMELRNGGKFNGAMIRILVPLFKEEQIEHAVEIHKQLSEDVKSTLIPLKSFRFYQTSEIRLFVKNMEETQDPGAREWIRLLEKSVHDGDQKAYENLIELIDA